MGEGGKDALRVVFDPGLKLEFHGAKVTSDGGLIPYRELDEAFGLTDRTENTMTALLRQSVFSRLAGYEDTNDAERLSVDPAMRHVIGGRAREKQAASTSQMGRFETEVLTQSKNLTGLIDLSGQWIDGVHEKKPIQQIILDMDSSVSETYGDQEGSLYNGYFGCTCYHPLFCFNQFGDLERAMLRTIRIPRRRRISLRDPPTCQCHTPTGNRAIFNPSRGPPLPQAGCPVSQLPIPSRQLGQTPPRGGEDRTSQRGIVPKGGFHRNEHATTGTPGGEILQRKRHG